VVEHGQAVTCPRAMALEVLQGAPITNPGMHKAAHSLVIFTEKPPHPSPALQHGFAGCLGQALGFEPCSKTQPMLVMKMANQDKMPVSEEHVCGVKEEVTRKGFSKRTT